MRSLFFLIQALGVIALAYWAYNENYATQDALRRVDRLNRDIGAARESLGVLRAEWAYLNRPDRLRELADLNFEALQLIPLLPEHFADVGQVDFPKMDMNDIGNPVDTMADETPLMPLHGDPSQNSEAQQ